MRITLPDNQWVDVKDVTELRAGDRRAVNAATEVKVVGQGADKTAALPGDSDDNMRYALLGRIIVGWNLQWPIPSQSVNGPVVLDNLTFGQLDALYDGIQEHMQVVTGQNKTPADKESEPTSASSI
jgi:hypothetical protein